jgi:hypothetical protein
VQNEARRVSGAEERSLRRIAVVEFCKERPGSDFESGLKLKLNLKLKATHKAESLALTASPLFFGARATAQGERRRGT